MDINERVVMNYTDFLQNKKFILESSGFDVDREDMNSILFDFQKDIVRWALAKGRSAIFADCGLGKTAMQLEWSYWVHDETNQPVLIVAPLAVCEQTIREGKKFDVEVKLCESESDVINGVNITNYEKLEKFNGSAFSGVVLDESSILKSFTGKIRNLIIDMFSQTKFKLACTATPAPNDYMELGNHSEFLGVMTRGEMLSMFFVHDGGQTSKWRLKGHAVDVFWQWMASWCVFMDNPSNLGYAHSGYDLPNLNIQEIIVDGDEVCTDVMTLSQRRTARKDSLQMRCETASNIVNASNDQWLVWCDMNAESALLHSLINNSVEVTGSNEQQKKVNSMMGFGEGSIKCLVTKPSIAGFGMNWQNCHNMIFTGLSDSYEMFYQALRRCWRFGQTEEVNVYIVISAKEGAVKQNIERKQEDFRKMQTTMIELTKGITAKELKKTCRLSTPYNAEVEMMLPKWEEFVI